MNKPPIAERRPQQRRRVLMSGIVTYADGAYSFDCAFRSVSKAGALITIKKNTPFPSKFYLIGIRDGIAYESKVVRNSGSEVGVLFKKTLPLSTMTDNSLNYLKRLWLAKA